MSMFLLAIILCTPLMLMIIVERFIVDRPQPGSKKVEERRKDGEERRKDGEKKDGEDRKDKMALLLKSPSAIHGSSSEFPEGLLDDPVLLGD
jgi:hypothetical protein